MQNSKKPAFSTTTILLIVFVNLILACVFWSFIGSFIDTDNLTSTASQEQQTAEAPPEKTGKWIIKTSGPDAPAGKTKADLIRVIELHQAGDNFGVSQMIKDGRAFTIANDTDIMMITPGFLRDEVRVIGGKYDGESCWVPSDLTYNN